MAVPVVPTASVLGASHLVVSCIMDSIVRAFLIEEQKIVKKVLKAQAKSSK
jgi:hypothetical protein